MSGNMTTRWAFAIAVLLKNNFSENEAIALCPPPVPTLHSVENDDVPTPPVRKAKVLLRTQPTQAGMGVKRGRPASGYIPLDARTYTYGKSRKGNVFTKAQCANALGVESGKLNGPLGRLVKAKVFSRTGTGEYKIV